MTWMFEMDTRLDKSFYVYTWARPDTGDVFYVGKGRLNRDIDRWRRSKHFLNVVAKLERNGHTPIIARIADNLTEEEAFALERKEIERIGRRDLGLGPLINKTNGGDGSSGYKPSLEAREKLSASLRKLFEDDPAQRQKRSDANRRRYEDPSERIKASEANRRAHAENPERWVRQSKSLRRHYADPAQRERLSAGLHKRFENPSARAKLAASARLTTPGTRNTSQFKGVSLTSDSGRWLAQITIDGQRRNLGTYLTKEAAAMAYDKAAHQAWPDGCFLNFPDRIDEELPESRIQKAAHRAPLRANNKSGFKGVSHSKPKGKWAAIITIDGKSNHIGYFDTAEAAAMAYDAVAYVTWGIEAYLNFPEDVGSVDASTLNYKARSKSDPRPKGRAVYKGVSYFKRTGKWIAQIAIDGKNKGLGYFLTAEDAARAYDAAAYATRGDGCYLNFPDEIERYKSAA